MDMTVWRTRGSDEALRSTPPPQPASEARPQSRSAPPSRAAPSPVPRRPVESAPPPASSSAQRKSIIIARHIATGVAFCAALPPNSGDISRAPLLMQQVLGLVMLKRSACKITECQDAQYSGRASVDSAYKSAQGWIAGSPLVFVAAESAEFEHIRSLWDQEMTLVRVDPIAQWAPRGSVEGRQKLWHQLMQGKQAHRKMGSPA